MTYPQAIVIAAVAIAGAIVLNSNLRAQGESESEISGALVVAPGGAYVWQAVGKDIRICNAVTPNGSDYEQNSVKCSPFSKSPE